MGKKSTGVNGAELARRWGISRGRVCQLKKDGMPMTSIEEAEAWRNSNYGGSGSKISAPASTAFKAARISASGASKRDLMRSDAAGVLARAVQAEKDAWATYEERKKRNQDGTCTDSEVNSGLRMWSEAMQVRLKSEASFLQLEKEAGNLIDPSMAKSIISKKLIIFSGIVDGLVGLAPRVNPEHPEHAHRELTSAAKQWREALQGV